MLNDTLKDISDLLHTDFCRFGPSWKMIKRDLLCLLTTYLLELL